MESVYRMEYTAGAADPYGNVVEGWLDPVLLEGRYLFDPGSSAEPRAAGSDRVVVAPALYGPYDMPFTARDKCVVRGETFEVVGEVRRWANSRREVGAVATLRRVTG